MRELCQTRRSSSLDLCPTECKEKRTFSNNQRSASPENMQNRIDQVKGLVLSLMINWRSLQIPLVKGESVGCCEWTGILRQASRMCTDALHCLQFQQQFLLFSST